MWPFDQNNQQVYQQYAQAYDTGNYQGFNNNQVVEHILQFMQGAPFDQQQQVYQQHFAQMPYDQRAFLAQQAPAQYYMDPNDPISMSQGFVRMGREQPDLLRRVLSHPLLLGGALGLAGMIAKHMLSRHNPEYVNQYGMGGYPQGGYQQQPGSYQQPYVQRELAEERAEVRELRRELRAEERHEERLEDRERHHHRREDY